MISTNLLSELLDVLRQSSRMMVDLIVQDGDDTASYLTIEGMRGYEYSVGIFLFMLAGVIVFGVILSRFFISAGYGASLKRGEKVLFLWILAGMIVAVVIGALQLLYGRLF